MNFLNSIFYKTLVALYKINVGKDGRAKNIVINAIYEALLIGKDGLDKAKLEMALSSATDEWLDYWGSFFGVPRVLLENDEHYRKRIIDEIIAPKSTLGAIKHATSRYLETHDKRIINENDIQLFEPWTELLKLDERGYLDGRARLISYDYWNYSIIDISLPDSTLITDKLIKYLNTIKAGGVKLVFTISPNWGVVIDKNKDKSRYRIWKDIYRETNLKATSVMDAFMLSRNDSEAYIKDSSSEGILDTVGLLEGRRKVFYDGIEFERVFYGTGVIRDHRRSAVISLYSILNRMGVKEATLEDVYNFEKESINGTRNKEGKLTITQNNICVVRENKNTKVAKNITSDSNGVNDFELMLPTLESLEKISFTELEEAMNKDFNLVDLESMLNVKNTDNKLRELLNNKEG